MPRKYFIVANFFSGSGKSQRALSLLLKQLSAIGIPSQVFLTPPDANLSEFIEDNYPEDTTDVVAIGGDGTINAVVNVIYGKDVVLSVIPTGTGNDFVKTIDIGETVESQINTTLHGETKLVDLGDCNGRKFVNGVGLGFDGQLVHDNIYTKSILKGHVKYYALVLKILGSYRSRPFKFEIDGQKIEENLIIMAIHNGTTFGGGFKLNPDSIIDDGLFNICTVARMPAWKRFLNIGRLSFGKHGKLKEVKFYTGKSIQIEASDKVLYAHMDGEFIGEPPLNISVLEKALKIRVQVTD